MHVVYVADWLGAVPDAGSGYGVAAHLMCASLQAAGHTVSALGVHGLPAPQSCLPTGVAPHHGPQLDAPVVIHTLPHGAGMVQQNLRKYGIQATHLYSVWETDSLPRWIQESIAATGLKLLVPSEFCAEGTILDATVVPHPAPKGAVPQPRIKNRMHFGYIGNITHRKDPWLVIKGYMEAFPEPQEGLGLILKLPDAPGVTEYTREICQNRRDITLIKGQLDHHRMQEVWGLIDIFVSAHHSEGFGLGPFEAALRGKGVVATNYSATTEFLEGYTGYTPIFAPIHTIGAGQDHLHMHPGNDERLMWAHPTVTGVTEALWTACMTHAKVPVYQGDFSKYSLQSVGRIFAGALAT